MEMDENNENEDSYENVLQKTFEEQMFTEVYKNLNSWSDLENISRLSGFQELKLEANYQLKNMNNLNKIMMEISREKTFENAFKYHIDSLIKFNHSNL